MNALNRKATTMTTHNEDDFRAVAVNALRDLASWAAALALVCALVVWSVNAEAQTAPCTALKGCTIERDYAKQRSHLENGGIPTGESEALLGKGEATRFLLRCWQHGHLIAERVVHALPPESRSVKPLTDHSGSSVVAFDLKNAVCIAESVTIAR
jgi:hypothetical protein